MTKEMVMWLKGFAVCLMVIHHSLAAPEMYINGFSFHDLKPYLEIIARFGGFAVVPMFAFLTGWTYYKHIYKSYGYSVKKIITFLFCYWLVLLFCSALAYSVCDYRFDMKEIGQEMFAISNNIMIFAWYVFLYIEIMIFLPFFESNISNKYSTKSAVEIAVGIILLAKVLSYILRYYGFGDTFVDDALSRYFFRYMPIVLSGYYSAKYNFIEKLCNRFTVHSNICIVGGVIGVFIFYHFIRGIGGISTGMFLCPIFIALVMSLKFNMSSFVNRIVVVLGRYSMNIWLLHGIFFAVSTREVFQKYAFWTNQPVLSVIWIIFICLCISVPMKKVQNVISKNISEHFFGF